MNILKSLRLKQSAVAVLIICVFLQTGIIRASATLSEETKYETTSESPATDEEWAFETRTDDININPEEEKDITVCINTDEVDFGKNHKPFKKNGTVYVPLRTFFESAGFNVKFNCLTGEITLTNGGLSVICRLFSVKCSVNGEDFELTNKLIYRKGCIYAPSNLLNVALDAKVWYDENGLTLTVSTGKYKNDERLRIVNGKLYMNGEPYYEISFNKFDLCYQIHAGYFYNHEWPEKKFQIDAAEDALKQLNSLGFRSIRVFVNSTGRREAVTNEESMVRYMQAMDDLFNLCDRYDIKMVVCMNLFDGCFAADGEVWVDQLGDLNSKSFANVEKYVRDFVGRYKDRKTVLMWEITNEGNLEADLKRISARQIGNYYAKLAEIIHEADPERLVTGGDGCLRDSQWHMYESSRRKGGNFWGNDNVLERFMAYRILYHGIDVISIHPYGVGMGTNYHFKSDDYEDGVVNIDFDYLAYESRVVGKPFYNGEAAVNADVPQEPDNDKKYLEMIIDSGIQITHWWTFHTDRQGFNDGYGWDITYGDLLESIINANRKIKERYCVNGVASENTSEKDSDMLFEKTKDSVEIKAVSDLPLIFVAAVILPAAAVIVIISAVRKKKIKNNR